MNLTESYQSIKSSLVAFVPKSSLAADGKSQQPKPPHILGTGFVVHDGLVVTSDRAIQAITSLPQSPDRANGASPAEGLLVCEMKDKGLAHIRLQLLGIHQIESANDSGDSAAQGTPGIALVHVKMRGLPAVTLNNDPQQIKEGCDIATAGFPGGADTLAALGWLHPISPILQKGIVSALLPSPRQKSSGLLVNIMVQGGASGSPVFLPATGEVVGLLYGGLQQKNMTLRKSPHEIEQHLVELVPSFHQHIFFSPTNLGYVVPATYIQQALKKYLDEKTSKFPEDTPTLAEASAKL